MVEISETQTHVFCFFPSAALRKCPPPTIVSNFGFSHSAAPWRKDFLPVFLSLSLCACACVWVSVFVSRRVRGLLRSVRATLAWCHISCLWAFYFFYFFTVASCALSSAATHNAFALPCLFTELAPAVTAVLSTRPLPAHCISTLQLCVHFSVMESNRVYSLKYFGRLIWISALWGQEDILSFTGSLVKTWLGQ